MTVHVTQMDLSICEEAARRLGFDYPPDPKTLQMLNEPGDFWVMFMDESIYRVTMVRRLTDLMMRTAKVRLATERYAMTGRRLPGSNRTKRLRKKRATELLKWYDRQSRKEER